ncbi:hypothetical protein GMAR_ORF233 [Golden Marseillevirus]|uniref:hypothetical protein n=1 Tax=Golden Marseillevirus TaxID=1720526 RepID=UPI000877A888|nr:hypothetical protein GMAR_ORF233 [Golden Marseillevirus]ALX27607.1 hypothetical protein GMAR_ORF233 [Golden Marseillevirus]
MKIANADCSAVLAASETEESIQIEEMDGEQLAWLVKFGVKCPVFVDSISLCLDPTNFMRGSPKRDNIFLKSPKDEFIRTCFEDYINFF